MAKKSIDKGTTNGDCEMRSKRICLNPNSKLNMDNMPHS